MYSPDKQLNKVIKQKPEEGRISIEESSKEFSPRHERKRFSEADIKAYRNEHIKEFDDFIRFRQFVLGAYGNNPQAFFSHENLESYKDNQAEAFFVFKSLIKEACIGVEDVKKYFSYFPGQLDGLLNMMLDEENWIDADFYKYIFPVVYKIAIEEKHETAECLISRMVTRFTDRGLKENFGVKRGSGVFKIKTGPDDAVKLIIEQLNKAVERKNTAKKKILSGYADGMLNPADGELIKILKPSVFDEDKIKKILTYVKIRTDLQDINSITETNKIGALFDKDLSAFTEKEQADFLRWAIASRHYREICQELEYSNPYNQDWISDRMERFFHGRQGTLHQYEASKFRILDHEFNDNVYYGFDKKKTQKDDSENSRPIGKVRSFFKDLGRGYKNIDKSNKEYEEKRISDFEPNKLIFSCLRQLANYKENKEENLDFILEFWGKNGNPIFKNVIADTLCEIDPELSVKKILEALNRAKNDSEEKDRLTALLFRLELGQFGISEEGVRYLGKIYDLGEYNDPKNFVRRLTAKGDIGIFDEKRKLREYFTLSSEDLLNEEKIIKANLKKFVLETLFLKNGLETEEEREKKEQYLKEFLENYFGFYNEEFFEKTGIKFNNLDFKEQGWFLAEFMRSDQEKKDEMFEFIKNYGESGLKTFLSLEFNSEMGDEILMIGKTLKNQPELAEKIFLKFANLTDGAEEEVVAFVKMHDELFHDKQLDADKANYAILRESFVFLKECIESLSNSRNDEKEKIVHDLLHKLGKDQEIKSNSVAELKELGKELNQRFSELTRSIFEREMLESYEKAHQSPFGSFMADRFLVDAQRMLDHMNKGQHSENDFYLLYKDFLRKEKKYDKQRVVDLIKHYKSLYSLTDEDKNNIRRNLEREAAKYKQEMIRQINEQPGNDSTEPMFKQVMVKEIERQAESMMESSIQQIIDEAENDPMIKPFKDTYEPLVSNLENLLKFQENFEYKLDQFIYGEDQVDLPEGAKEHISYKVFQKYDEIINLAKKKKEDLTIMIGRQKDISDEKAESIANSLIDKAKTVLKDYSEKILSKSDVTEGEILKELETVNGQIILLDQILRNIPREEVADLDLRRVSEIERVEDMPAHDIYNHKELLDQITSIIAVQFPPGDVEEFLDECKNNKDLSLTISMANNQVLTFFSKEKRGKNFEYVDWFISNPDAPLKGLGEATARLGFVGEKNEKKNYYLVAKPHVKSFYLFIEKFGFSSFGTTDDKEYKHHYARCAKLAENEDLVSKNLREEEFEALLGSIKKICVNNKSMESMVALGKKLKVCRIEYHGQNHHDDISKNDPDGWILEQIDEQYKEGYVLTRFLSDGSNKNNQTYYAIFEQQYISQATSDDLAYVVGHSHQNDPSRLHSTSKKALSS